MIGEWATARTRGQRLRCPRDRKRRFLDTRCRSSEKSIFHTLLRKVGHRCPGAHSPIHNTILSIRGKDAGLCKSPRKESKESIAFTRARSRKTPIDTIRIPLRTRDLRSPALETNVPDQGKREVWKAPDRENASSHLSFYFQECVLPNKFVAVRDPGKKINEMQVPFVRR